MNVNKNRNSAARSSSGLNESKNQEPEEVDGDLAETALTLLLALLEGDQSLNATSSPLLLVIASKISNPNFLELKDDLDFKRLVREARLVLTARFSASQDQEGGDLLASSNGKNLKDASKDSKATVIEEALIPSILSIFLQAIQDDETYLYLNAVQGLAELGLRREDSSDRKMLDSLLDIYVGKDRSGGWGRENSKLSKQSKLSQNEADLRLRIGEALTVVIQSCGDRLSSHASRLISPLLTASRDPLAPSTFKSSIISILGTCVEAFPLALASNDLSLAMTSTSLELLQIETVAREQPGRISEKIKKKGGKRNKPQEQVASDSVAGKTGVKVFMEDADDVELDSSEEEREEKKPTQDSAISTDSKLPHLRRSALLLLNLLVRGTRDQLEIFTLSLEKFHSQRSNVSGDADLNMIFNRSKDRADEDSFSSLRLPNGSILSLASTKEQSSSKTEEKSSMKEARPPSLALHSFLWSSFLEPKA
ncbi:hypothetical protein L7F22_014306 [Adiantum nelumboides]|nr:hypothetical protein [Adiantum nelumboides]